MNDRKPTPGIERMHPAIARRHFQARWEEIKKNLSTLPIAEQLRAAADFLDEQASHPNDTNLARMALATAQNACRELATTLAAGGGEHA